METTTIRCSTCGGEGELHSWWTPVYECPSCLGSGWENIEIEFTADQVAA